MAESSCQCMQSLFYADSTLFFHSETLKYLRAYFALMHFPVFLVTLLNCISIFCVVLMPHDHHIVTEQYRQISV